MHNESITKTFTVATLLAIVCAVVVSLADVSLKGLQRQNQELDKQTNILRAAGLVDLKEKVGAAEAAELFKRSVAVVVDLESGELVLDADPKAVAADKTNVRPLDKDDDIAGIASIPKRQVVYAFYDADGAFDSIALPIVGTGLWSTLYGFLSLNSDLETVRRLVFYDHGETPGLGGEITNPAWVQKWEDKVAFNDDGLPILRVVKGTVDPSSPDANSQVDGISGATLTGDGVTNTIEFWLGDMGYGPFLNNLRAHKITFPPPGATQGETNDAATSN
ncbi:MAG: Na(+)-translocating NADH-quinone reductase subunit C [Thermoguttaceae bacterium]|jgi:Na+-transporting NADH:ubiquinone oxidoreductase subunit C